MADFKLFMGLDTVELIQKIEDHFILPIPDREAEQMTTIRHIAEYLVKISNADEDRKAVIEKEVLDIVAEHAGFNVTELSLDMSLTGDLGMD